MNIKVVLFENFNKIMIYSDWICNIYKEDFEIKEKRDEYRERIYYQKILIRIEK